MRTPIRTIPQWGLLCALCLFFSGCGGDRSSELGAPPAATSSPAPSSTATVTFNGNRANYQIQRGVSGTLVIDLVGNGGSQDVSLATGLQFADMKISLAIANDAKTISDAQLKSLIELYIAFFNRVPDAEGMSYWISQLRAGLSLGQIAESFYNAGLTFPDVTGYSANMSNADFVKLVYANVLGRTGATTPNAEEVGYWAGELDSGRQTKIVLISTMLTSARTFVNDPAYGWVPALLDNKISAGRYVAIEQGVTYLNASDSISKSVAIAAAVTPSDVSKAKILLGISDAQFNLTLTPTAFQSMRAPIVVDPPLPSFTILDVIGTFRVKSEPNNNWLIGTIALKAGSTSTLLWTNQAGFSWELTPDYAKHVLITGSENPYLNSENGKYFTLEFQSGKVVGFQFMGSSFVLDGAKVIDITPYLTSYFVTGVDATTVPAGFTYGFSMYTAIWPLIDRPIRGFGAGLPGTWLQPNNDDFFQPLLPPDNFLRVGDPNAKDFYRSLFQTVEGSGAYWTATRFPSTQPKYRINGTPNGYIDELSAPGWEFGQNAIDASSAKSGGLPMGSKGVAQLSNRLLMPPDGLTFKLGTAGELFGIAWMALPLTQAKTGTNPVGDQSWTFFVNSTNFKGPAAFYVPDVWEVLAKSYPTVLGRGLDVRPGKVGNFAMEWGAITFYQSQDKNGVRYVKLPRMAFPTDAKGNSCIVADFTLYSGAALFNPFKTWLTGSNTMSGKFAADGAIKPSLSTGPIYMYSQDNQVIMTSEGGLKDWIVPSIIKTPGGGTAWTFQMKGSAANGVFPEYFQKVGDVMRPILESQVPPETGLKELSFPFFAAADQNGADYTSPASWSVPAALSGPYSVVLNDGSTVTYAWYRFVDQPSLQGFGWSEAEKSRLQSIVEKIHTNWKNNTEFMAAQTIGDLATLDSALFVTPPKGLEIGYVPVVVKQAKLK
ncbi:DUF4214 domain-containing protein [Undibacterium fentianense]|uniref:DUF4214 domain-containing protein n=1 Tax=Undibacterium fentianense TaxID=2828728 RepID=A0A941ICQ9_9BURK|nr:DUF4214 domain-containing protein [Undibacterium fentianense]MBR7800464.1 DUF4214 domain-containing protein [Undibacterium fentianense]